MFLFFSRKSQLLAENVGPFFRFAERKILYTPLALYGKSIKRGLGCVDYSENGGQTKPGQTDNTKWWVYIPAPELRYSKYLKC